MQDNFPTYEQSGLDRQTWLEAYTLHLEGLLSQARSAARIMKPMNYAAICDVARRHGYALTVHGTLARDVDMLACPWVESADTPEALAAAITEATGGISKQWTTKPHGRRSVVILMAGGYVDLCIMPRGAL